MSETFWAIFEYVVNIYQAFLIMHFVCSSLNHNYHTKKGKIIFVLGSIGNAILITVFSTITIYEGLLGIIYSIYLFVFSLLFLRGALLKKLFISILTNLCIIGISSAVTNLMSIVLKDTIDNIYKTNATSRFLTVVIVQALITYLFAVILHFTKDGVNSLKPKEWGLIISVLGISFVTFAAIHITAISYNSAFNSLLLMIAELGIILINVVCWYITVNLSKSNKRKEELLVLNKQNEYSYQYAETVKEQYEQTRRLRHDMKQYCTVLDGLIADEKYDEARALISENYKNISHSEVVVDVGNDFVNSILNAKLTLAKSHGIDVICSTEKELSGIESADLCNLLGNMLDNAIEAAQKCEPEKRSIELNISSSGNRLNITVRNSVLCSILKENPSLKTSKHDKSEHGFGIKSIKSVAEKYGGTTDFYEENMTFVCRVELQKSTKYE